MKRTKTRKKITWQSMTVALLVIGGLGAMVYPTAASWFAKVNQSEIIVNQIQNNPDIDKTTQLELAHRYNKALTSGAIIEVGKNIPQAADKTKINDKELAYENMLKVNDTGLMARVIIPSIAVDLPVYHGTDETTLLEGAGHLQGTSLPVGGENTRSVITAHRGLANAKMFTDLDKVKLGETFTIEVMGEVLTYKVTERKVVEPHETEELRVVKEKDLVTLITCTPLGINSHRILLTGERITPTPIKEIERASEPPAHPGFPWWAVGLGSGIIIASSYVILTRRPTE